MLKIIGLFSVAFYIAINTSWCHVIEILSIYSPSFPRKKPKTNFNEDKVRKTKCGPLGSKQIVLTRIEFLHKVEWIYQTVGSEAVISLFMEPTSDSINNKIQGVYGNVEWCILCQGI